MTQDEIISMAKQCGMAPDKYGLFHNIEESEDGADLESFAALVSARAAVIEREKVDALVEALTIFVQHFGDPFQCARAALAKAQGYGK